MIDVNPNRCIRSAEELSGTRRVLLQQADIVTEVCSYLRSDPDEAMHSIAEKLERYVSDIEWESRVSESMSLMLEKVAEEYLRTERDSLEYGDQIYIAPVTYGTIFLGDVTVKAKEHFEEY
ncbi:MAG: hypothetical protein IKG17_06530 [Mogibacterium sp.]|nr:hypothetical protein [Mogibacterium sp.]